MRKFRILLIVGVIAVAGALLAGCGSEAQTESPLKISYKKITKNSDLKRFVRINYDKEKEYLEIGFYSGAKIDKIFNILNKSIKGNAIGTLYFHTLYDVEDSELEEISESIGKLNPKSVMVFGLSTELVECANHDWTNILAKSDVLYTLSVTEFRNYEGTSKSNLQNVKKLWLYNDAYSGIGYLPNLEEIGIYATVEKSDNRASTQGKVYSSSGSTYSYPTVAANEYVTNSKGEKETKKVEQEPFEFNESYKKTYEYEPLAEAKNLKRITIAPCFEKYTMDAYGAGYIFALSNVRNDIMINEPNKKLSDNSYINIDELNKTNAQLTNQDKKNIVGAFLSEEVKSTYSKAKKFKKKNKKTKVRGKALVYMAKPDSSMYKKKRVYHYSGSVLTEDELGKAIKQPERSHDYKYFVYAYPTYKYYGKYNKGTKAYTQTYWVQVFDLDKKIAYKAIKVGSQKPEQTFRYSGSAPAKHSGTLSYSKV